MALSYVDNGPYWGAQKAAGTSWATGGTWNGLTQPKGDLVIVWGGCDNTSATGPTVTVSSASTSAWTHAQGTSPQAASAGGTIAHIAYAMQTVDPTSYGVTLTYSASTVGKTGMSIYVKGAEFVSSGGGSGASGSITANPTETVFLVITYESDVGSAIPTGWSQIRTIGTTGGGGASNVTANLYYKVGGGSFSTTSVDSSYTYMVFRDWYPPVDQAAYRFYSDGTESGSTALGAQDTAITADLSSSNQNILVRCLLQNGHIGNIVSSNYQLEAEKNGSGNWVPVSVPGISDSYAQITNSVGTALAFGITEAGQSIHGAGLKLNQVSFFSIKNGSPSGTLTAKLYAHSGTFGTSSKPTGAALATSDSINASSVSTSVVWTVFTFSGFVFLEPATDYCIVIAASATGDASNYIGYYTNTTSPHAGNSLSYISPNWSADNTVDTLFRLYTSPAAYAFDSTNLTNGAATTNRLTGGIGSFSAGEVAETGRADGVAVTGSNYTELLYTVILDKTLFANGDTVRFRVTNAAVTFTYTKVPTVNITTGPATPSGNILLSGVSGGTAAGYAVVSGSATVSGAGGGSATGYAKVAGAVVVSAVGTITTAGVKPGYVGQGNAAISAAGTITANGIARVSGTVAVSGVGTIAAIGSAIVSGNAAISATSSITANGVAKVAGDVIISGISSITTAGSKPAYVGQGNAAITGVGTIVADGSPRTIGNAAVTGAGVITSTGLAVVSGNVAVTGAGTIAVTGKVSVAGTATISAVSSIVADGKASVTGSALISTPGLIAVSGLAIVSGNAVISAVGNITANGVAKVAGDVIVTGISNITVAGFKATYVGFGDAAISASSSITTDGKASVSGAAVVSAASSITANGSALVSGAVVVAGIGTITVVGFARVSGDAAIAGIAAISANGKASVSGAVAISNTSSSIVVNGVAKLAGDIIIFGAGTITTNGLASNAGVASVSGLATIFAAGAKEAPQGLIRVYLGTWQLKPIKAYNGSAFVQKPLKRWNGSAWVTTS